MTERDPRRAFRVVDDFEAELADYCGSPYAVAVDSCTNALFLTLRYELDRLAREADQYVIAAPLELPSSTYVGVLQAARNAGWLVHWTSEEWQPVGMYALPPTRVVDSARRLHRGLWFAAGDKKMHTGDVPIDAIVCLSFHASKQLPLGRGGAILTSDEELDGWLRRARADGRPEGGSLDQGVILPGWHCYMPPPTAALGLWQLTTLEDLPRPKEIYVDPDLSALE